MLIGSTESARPGQHLCLMYWDEHELCAAVCEFVRSGLMAGDLIVVVTGSTSRTVRACLADGGVDCTAAFEAGQIQVLSTPEAEPNHDGSSLAGIVHSLQSLLDERGRAGYSVLRLASEVDLTYGPETAEQMVARERLGNELIATHPVIGLCLYDRRRHDTSFLRAVEAEHVDQVVPSAEWDRDRILAIGHLDEGFVLRLSGEIDLSNRDALRRALERAAARAEGDVVVDLSATSFIDAGGLHAFSELAERDPSRRIVLQAPPTFVERVLQLGGWQALPNLIVVRGGERL